MEKNIFSTIPFEDALKNVREGKTTYMLRAAWLKNVDSANKIIPVYDLDRFIRCEKGDYQEQLLREWRAKKDEIGWIGKEAKFLSEDIFAEDWVSVEGWRIAESKKEYEKMIAGSN